MMRIDISEKAATLETRRLVLRLPTVDDAKSIVDAYTSDPDVTKFLLFLPYDDIVQARQFLQSRLDEIREGRGVYWLIVPRNERSPIGAIEMRIRGNTGDIGYVIGKRWWGQGIVPEAVQAVMGFARATLGLQRLTGICDYQNAQSARVFQKCGFERIGVENGVIVHPALGPEPRPVIRFVATLSPPRTLELRSVKLRPAAPPDQRFIERVYFETQRWLIEKLFGWRGDDVERSKFNEFYDEAHTSIVEIAGNAAGWLTVLRNQNNVEIDSIYLARDWQGQGLGTYLLQELIEEADAEGKTVTISTAKINRARRLYERLGFVAVDETKFKAYMVRAPYGDEQVEIREEMPSDVIEVCAVHRAAFGRGNESDLVEALRDAGLVASSIVASKNGKIIGNALFSRVALRAPGKTISAAALAPVAVVPEHQSRGIGTRIIRHGLALCAQRHYDAVLVLGDPQYYMRFGFSSELAQQIRGPYSNLGRHWMALELRRSSIPPFCRVRYPAVFQGVDR